MQVWKMGVNTARSRETGSGGQYEEEQEIPEGSADRRRI